MSVADVKALLQVTEKQLTNCSGTNITALVLCKTTCSNSFELDSLALRLGLQRNILKLTIIDKFKEERTDTKVFRLTIKTHHDQDFESFTVRLFEREHQT